MEQFKIVTLVDITRTKCSRAETDKIKVGQQANFNTLLQSIGIRSNVEWHVDPEMHTGRLPTGEGKANHWVWEFFVERDFVFTKDNDPVGLLVEDLNGVPIIPDLMNNVELSPAAFLTSGEQQNIWITIISKHNS